MLPELAAALLLVSGSFEAQAGDPARVEALHAQARLGEALAEAARLEDAGLAAEWRCYLFTQSGDLPAALRAAEDGLLGSPDHRGLLVNATGLALSLGLAELAERRAEHLTRILASAPAEVEEGELERAERLLADARAARAREHAGRTGRARARWTVGLGLGLALGAMLVLAWRSS